MALVAYSDESDYSDNEETSVTNSKLDVKGERPGVSNDYSQDLTLTSKQNGNIPLSSDKDQNTEVVTVETPIVGITLNSTEIENNDVVDDVPTVKTWNIIENKEAGNQMFKAKEPKTKKLKLILPALSEFDDDDDDDGDEDLMNASSKDKLQPSSRGTGLFAVLPKPRSVTSLVPLNVFRKKAVVPDKRKREKQSKPAPLVANDSDDEFPSNSESNDFFSLADSHSPPTLQSIPEPDVSINPPAAAAAVDVTRSFPLSLSEPTHELSALSTAEQQALLPEEHDTNEDYIPFVNNPSPAGIDVQALRRLAGRRNVGEVPDIIDINADDALMSRDEWVTRALCDEKPKKSFSKKREGNPTQQQKRKHQITYLAHQAQEREQDLQNSWGQNRFTKIQTQSKYGF